MSSRVGSSDRASRSPFSGLIASASSPSSVCSWLWVHPALPVRKYPARSRHSCEQGVTAVGGNGHPPPLSGSLRWTQDIHNFVHTGGDTDRLPMVNEPAAPTASSATARCAECQSRLAHDQRYCVECGARRGPLPAQIAGLIGAVLDPGPVHPPHPTPALPPGTPLAESVLDQPPASGPQFKMPGPRAAAIAVMGMLGFGVIAGSLVGGASVATLASAPLIVVGMGHSTATPTVHTVVVSQAGGSGNGGGAAAAGGGTAAAAQTDVQVSTSPTTSPTSTSGTDTSSGALTGFRRSSTCS